MEKFTYWLKSGTPRHGDGARRLTCGRVAACWLLLLHAGCGSDPAAEGADGSPGPRLTGVYGTGWPEAVPADGLAVEIQFSRGMRAVGTCRVACAGSNLAAATGWTNAGTSLVVTATGLAPGLAYTLHLEGFHDLEGRTLVSGTTGFRTAAGPAVPVVVWRAPEAAASNVALDQPFVLVKFGGALCLDGLRMRLVAADQELMVPLLPGLVDGVVVFGPLPGLPPATTYRVFLETIAGTGAPQAVDSWAFITGAPSRTNRRAGHLVLAEVCHGGFAGGTVDDEFIRLYNPTGSTVDLGAGYRLYRAPASGNNPSLLCDFTKAEHFTGDCLPTGRRIAPGGSFLVTRENAASALRLRADAVVKETRPGLTADNTAWLCLGGPPGTVANIVDLLGYGAAQVFAGRPASDPGSGACLERRAYAWSCPWTMADPLLDGAAGNGYDSGCNADDWFVRQLP